MHCSLCRYTDLSLILVAETNNEFNFGTINSLMESWRGVLDLA